MKPVYFNHDGGVDDLVSLFLLLQMEEIELIGVSVIGADSYIEPAVSASEKIIQRLGHQPIEVAASKARGKNPFPKEWRMHAFFVDALPVLNEHYETNDKDITTHVEAYQDIIDKVTQSEEPVTLLFTGPLTDLAQALTADPTITSQIERLVWMGGTFLDKGNVEEPEHDGTAEWNAFWDPEAVATVFNSDIEIDMVALESTNQVPLTWEVRQMWARERQYIGVEFLGVSYAAMPPLTHFQTNSTYFLWDVLTTAYTDEASLAHKHTVKASVVIEGPSQGRTYIDKTDGRLVGVVDDVDRDDFFRYITDLAKKAE